MAAARGLLDLPSEVMLMVIQQLDHHLVFTKLPRVCKPLHEFVKDFKENKIHLNCLDLDLRYHKKITELSERVRSCHHLSIHYAMSGFGKLTLQMMEESGIAVKKLLTNFETNLVTLKSRSFVCHEMWIKIG
jgi:hypothetical protein